ncbi:MAG: adenosylcobinamide-GDP ribazoletransferase, partial [Magnetovibrio sp.]|nr:adenosylcobinamide-GDP ribazoletransferase [Magnetovibrio sp.]
MSDKLARQDLLERLFTGWGRDIAVAGAFLTRLPFRPKGPTGMADLGPASRAFPLIGLIVGGLAGGRMWLAAAAALHPLACGVVG